MFHCGCTTQNLSYKYAQNNTYSPFFSFIGPETMEFRVVYFK